MLDRTHPVTRIAKLSFFADKPQNLPVSGKLIIASALALLAVTASMDVFRSFQENLFVSGVQIVIYAAIVWLVLRLAKKAARWPQTIVALFGTACLIRAISYVPLEIIWNTTGSTETAVYWATVTALPFGIWSLCVSAYVMKEALETTPVKAFFIAFGIALLVSFVLIAVIGFEPGSADSITSDFPISNS